MKLLISEKICLKCKLLKKTADFHRDKTQKDGFQHSCRECRSLYRRQYYINNKTVESGNRKQYYQKNKSLEMKNNAVYMLNRRRTDPNFKLGRSLRTRLNKIVQRSQKSGSAVRDLGCLVDDCKKYLESKFQPGWSWENWGQIWQIDHIKPLSSFDLTDRCQFLKACHYTNLQPLSIENHKKKTSAERNY